MSDFKKTIKPQLTKEKLLGLLKNLYNVENLLNHSLYNSGILSYIYSIDKLLYFLDSDNENPQNNMFSLDINELCDIDQEVVILDDKEIEEVKNYVDKLEERIKKLIDKMEK